MERDAPGSLRHARERVEECRSEQRLALRALQVEGAQALRALNGAGYTSTLVAKGLATSGSTVRKLTSDGDQHAWKPRSRSFYEALDAYTQSKLGRAWGLVDLRNAYDRASSLLAEAERRRSQAAAEADGAVPTADLGILYMPGLPEERLERPLRLLGDALVTSFVTHDGAASVRVVGVRAEATESGPARLVLEPTDAEGDDHGHGGGASARRWLVAVAPVRHPVTGDAELRDFLRWLLAALPWFAADVFDRRLARVRCLPRSWPGRWLRTAGNVLLGLVGIPLLVLTLILAALALAALRLPGVRAAGRAGARWLMGGFGLTYAHAAGQVSFSVQADRMRRDLFWMRQQCRRVAVVAHGQGVPVAHSLVCGQRDEPTDLLVTLGSPLRRFRFASWMHEHGSLTSALGGLVGLVTWTVTTVSRVGIVLSFSALLLWMLTLRIPLWLTALAAVSGGLAYLGMSILAVTAGRILHGEVLDVRRGVAAQQRERGDGHKAPTTPRWLDLATPTDPVADGAYLAATMPLGEMHEAVTHQVSTLADHAAYLTPGSEALRRLATELAAVAAAPAPLAVPDGDLAAEGRRRGWWLVVARWAAGIAGLLTATAVWPPPGARLPSGNWRGIAAFLLVWLVATVVAATALKGLWLLWDQVERRYRPPSRGSADSTPLHAMFVFFLEVMAVMVATPALALLGWLPPVTWRILALPRLLDVPAPTVVLLAVMELLLVSYAIAFVGGSLIARKEARDRRAPGQPPDPLVVAPLLLRLLPDDGLVVNGASYRAAPVAWDVSTWRYLRRGKPYACPTPVRMLLRGDAVLLDLRDDCVERVEPAARPPADPDPAAGPRHDPTGTRPSTQTVYVHGRKVYPPCNQPPGKDGASQNGAGEGRMYRLATARDWLLFRRELPELLRQVAPPAPPPVGRSAVSDRA